MTIETREARFNKALALVKEHLTIDDALNPITNTLLKHSSKKTILKLAKVLKEGDAKKVVEEDSQEEE
jgi:hypothetical protein